MNKKIVLTTLLVASFFTLSACQSKESVNQPPLENTVAQPEVRTVPITNLTANTITKAEWPSIPQKFNLLFSNDKELEKYSFFNTYSNSQQKELYIFPQDIKEGVSFGKVTIEGKNIYVNYAVGKPKIPRVIGQVQYFTATGLSLNMELLESGVYHLHMIDKDGTKTMTKDLTFKKPYVATSWKSKNIVSTNKNEIVFSATLEDGEWALWKIDLKEKDLKPVRLTSRHTDMPLNQLPTLGAKDINTPIPVFNEKIQKIIYHSQHDLWTVDIDGTHNYPLTINNDENPTPDALYSFDVNPQLSKDGNYILFKRIFEPMRTELWLMSLDGEYKEKINLPDRGTLQSFSWSPDNKTIVALISTEESEIRNGETNVWTLYPKQYNERIGSKEITKKEICIDYIEKDNLENCKAELEQQRLEDLNPIKEKKEEETEKKYNKRLEPRKLNTGGYKVEDIDFSHDSKTIAYSLKLNQTTDDVLTDIWSANANNTEQKRLTPKDGQKDILPSWSPDNNKIAFLSSNNSIDFHLWIMDKDGQNRHLVNEHISSTDKPVWSQTGDSVYLTTAKGGIYQINVSNGTEKVILEDGQ